MGLVGEHNAPIVLGVGAWPPLSEVPAVSSRFAWVMWRIISVSVVLLAVGQSAVNAQLTDVTWAETIGLTSNQGSSPKSGVNAALPEPLNASLTGAGYQVHGSVSFISPGDPEHHS